MSLVRVDEFGGKSLDHAEKILAGIPGAMEKAVKNAMGRAVSALRSNSAAIIRENYDISAANLRTHNNIKVQYTYQSGVTASVVFHGNKIPLYRYGGAAPKQPVTDHAKLVNAMIQGRWQRVHPSIAAAGHQLKGTSPARFTSAFVAQMKSGHIGIFERTGGAASAGGDAIRELMGSSIPQMLGNKGVQEKLAAKISQKFDERIEHEINRMLNGWGM